MVWKRASAVLSAHTGAEREVFVDNLLVQIHFVIVMIRWTGLAPWKFESPFPGRCKATVRLDVT